MLGLDEVDGVEVAPEMGEHPSKRVPEAALRTLSQCKHYLSQAMESAGDCMGSRPIDT